jgi:diadenylate cyclase
VFEGLYHLFESRPALLILRDVADVFIVAYVLYRALLVLRGTRAMQMGVGLGVVFLVYFGAGFVGLATLLSLLSWLLSSIILVVVVVFQNDIRRALIRMGGSAWLGSGREQQSRVIDEVVAAATELARHRMGAIIAFEQDANILEFVKSEGITLEATVTRELLVSLFVPESVNKLHDGAVLIRDLKIARAGVFFPCPRQRPSTRASARGTARPSASPRRPTRWSSW